MIKILNKSTKYLVITMFALIFFAVSSSVSAMVIEESSNQSSMLNLSKINKMHYLIIGNSVTRHVINGDWPAVRGMTATRDDKDYVRVLEKLFKDDGIKDVQYTIEPFGGMTIEETREYERKNLKNISGHSLDLIILQIAENILPDAPLSEYLEVIKSMILRLKIQVPGAEIFIMDSMYFNPTITEGLISLANSTGTTFISIDRVQEDESYRSFVGDVIYDNDGEPHDITRIDVAAHPNDKGHEYIAHKIHDFCKDRIFLKRQNESSDKITDVINSFEVNDYLNSVENLGDTSRVGKFLKKAKAGSNLTVLGFGGSITAGAGLIYTNEDLSYGRRVTNYLQKKYPNSNFRYINAGLSGTNLTYSVFRVKEDVLKYNPDLVILDYSVNNRGDTDIKNLYSSVVSQINLANEETAMINIHFTETIDSGRNDIITKVVKRDLIANQPITEAVVYFDLPSVSYHSLVWNKMESNIIKKEDIFQDYVHPTEHGHLIAANLITNLLDYIEKLYQDKDVIIKPMKKLGIDSYANYEYITYDGNGGGLSKERGHSYFARYLVEGDLVAYKGWISVPTKENGLVDFDIVDGKKVVIGFQFTDAEGESITFAKMDGNGSISKLGDATAPKIGLFTTVTYENVGNYLGIMADLPKGHVVIYGIGILK